ncbi:protein of unknown function [Nocardioides terrae]|uniref:DUF4192 domain-containing protein n=1 Tax=Nocardioides terrae TaxID=574651 RepID=A0A1I1FRT0_9ACTN|nr:DUF4192 domain-containing protein [Nocardioides terrae]SFC02025.1 protein of unknown function [Nocardioides terrae]
MTTYTARSAEDVLALVPVVLGFEPHESIVMLTFGGSQPLHARVDLPEPEDVQACVSALLAPAVRHRVAQVVLALFSGRDRVVRLTAGALSRRFRVAGIHVIDVIQVHDGRWFAPLGRSGVPVDGVRYDVSDHPFRAQAVLDGKVTVGSRDEVAERIRADGEAVAAVEDALGELWEQLPPDLQVAFDDADAPETALALLGRVRPDGPELRAVLARHLVAGTVPDDEEAARILLAVYNGEIRDHAWVGMRREDAVHHVRLWTDLLRRAPDGLVAGAAGVLAFAAWMHGDGALAWCAVDRCLDEAPDHGLGRLVADALERAVPPLEEWPADLGHDRFPRGLAG